MMLFLFAVFVYCYSLAAQLLPIPVLGNQQKVYYPNFKVAGTAIYLISDLRTERGAPERELFNNIAMLTSSEGLKNGNSELDFNSLNNSLKNASLTTADPLNRWIEREAPKTESFASVLTSCLQEGLDYRNSWSNFCGESFFENSSSLQIVASGRGPITVLKEPVASPPFVVIRTYTFYLT